MNNINSITANIKNFGMLVEELTVLPHTYKLKPLIINQIKEAYNVDNLKETFLLLVIANLFKDILIMIKINFGNQSEIIFRILRKVIPRGTLFAIHMILNSTTCENEMILTKC